MVQGITGGDRHMTSYTGLSSEACVRACRYEEDCVAVSHMVSEDDTSMCFLYAEGMFMQMQDSTATTVFLDCPQSECCILVAFMIYRNQTNFAKCIICKLEK